MLRLLLPWMDTSRRQVHGIYWGSYQQHAPRLLRKSLEDSVQWLAQGKVKVPVSHRRAPLDR